MWTLQRRQLVPLLLLLLLGALLAWGAPVLPPRSSNGSSDRGGGGVGRAPCLEVSRVAEASRQLEGLLLLLVQLPEATREQEGQGISNADAFLPHLVRQLFHGLQGQYPTLGGVQAAFEVQVAEYARRLWAREAPKAACRTPPATVPDLVHAAVQWALSEVCQAPLEPRRLHRRTVTPTTSPKQSLPRIVLVEQPDSSLSLGMGPKDITRPISRAQALPESPSSSEPSPSSSPMNIGALALNVEEEEAAYLGQDGEEEHGDAFSDASSDLEVGAPIAYLWPMRPPPPAALVPGMETALTSMSIISPSTVAPRAFGITFTRECLRASLLPMAAAGALVFLVTFLPIHLRQGAGGEHGEDAADP